MLLQQQSSVYEFNSERSGSRRRSPRQNQRLPSAVETPASHNLQRPIHPRELPLLAFLSNHKRNVSLQRLERSREGIFKSQVLRLSQNFLRGDACVLGLQRECKYLRPRQRRGGPAPKTPQLEVSGRDWGERFSLFTFPFALLAGQFAVRCADVACSDLRIHSARSHLSHFGNGHEVALRFAFPFSSKIHVFPVRSASP